MKRSVTSSEDDPDGFSYTTSTFSFSTQKIKKNYVMKRHWGTFRDAKKERISGFRVWLADFPAFFSRER
jgi:hypothetical protein